MLTGAWVVTAAVFLGTAQGPALKFKAGAPTRRAIWVSDAFKAERAQLWLVMLETLSNTKCKWKFLPDAQTWAQAKVAAESKGKSSEVLALVSKAEAEPGTSHIFAEDAFFDFVSNLDATRTRVN